MDHGVNYQLQRKKKIKSHYRFLIFLLYEMLIVLQIFTCTFDQPLFLEERYRLIKEYIMVRATDRSEQAPIVILV